MAGRDDKSDLMPKVDFSELQLVKKYAKIVEEENRERALRLRKLRTRNKWVGGLLGATVFGIYSYSILAVKQETFLDDFDEPAREPSSVLNVEGTVDIRIMATRLPPLPSMRDIIRLYRLRAVKQLSQNFLMDLRLTSKIVKCAGNIHGAQICEVGPGPGSITRSILAKEPRRLVLIEKDPRFEPALQMLKDAVPGVEVICNRGDVLQWDMSQAFDERECVPWDATSPPNIHIIGNLPFSVATPLIIKWLRNIHNRESAWRYGRVGMTLTFQKEVADRICAPILSDARGRLSVMCQNWCAVTQPMGIPGRAFVPPPDVDVGVVRFTPRVRPIIPFDFTLIEKVLRTIFHFRQKYSIKAARLLFPEPQREALAAEMFERADLCGMIRPFQISNEEWGRLCAAYKLICDREPRLYKYNHRASRTDTETRWDYHEPPGAPHQVSLNT